MPLLGLLLGFRCCPVRRSRRDFTHSVSILIIAALQNACQHHPIPQWMKKPIQGISKPPAGGHPPEDMVARGLGTAAEARPGHGSSSRVWAWGATAVP